MKKYSLKIILLWQQTSRKYQKSHPQKKISVFTSCNVMVYSTRMFEQFSREWRSYNTTIIFAVTTDVTIQRQWQVLWFHERWWRNSVLGRMNSFADIAFNVIAINQWSWYFQKLILNPIYSDAELVQVKKWIFIHTESMSYANFLNLVNQGGLGMFGNDLDDTLDNVVALSAMV